MFKKGFVLLLIFTANIEGQTYDENRVYPLTNTFRVTNFDVETNNTFVQFQRNGLVSWIKSVSRDKNAIDVYVQSLSVQQLLPAGNLCSPTFFFDYLRQLNAVLTNKRACPIQEGTTINIYRGYTENLWHLPLTCLGTEFVNFTLYDKVKKSKIMSMEAELSSSGAACKTRNN